MQNFHLKWNATNKHRMDYQIFVVVAVVWSNHANGFDKIHDLLFQYLHYQ